MKIVFCRDCGEKIYEMAETCPHCNVAQAATTVINKNLDIPDSIKGWSWGAFILGGIWAIGNRTWIGLLSFIPIVGSIMHVILGVKGREWAWRNKEWRNVEHFNHVQRKWSFWGVLFVVVVLTLNILSAFQTIPAYQDYVQRAKQQELN